MRFRAKFWLPFLLVAVSLGCSARAETTARTETSDGTATGVAPVTSTALAPTTTGQGPVTSTGQGTTTTTDQSRSKACRLGKLEARDPVSARCVFYDVYGLELAHVALQIAFGVRHPHRGTWHAASTEWHVSWSFGSVGPTPCRLTSPTVRLTLEYTLPRWKAPGRVDPAAVTEWNRYLGRLWQHERGHARTGLAAARDIRSALAGLSAAPDCRRLELKANATARRIFDRWDRKNVAYDEATDGGAATGAVLIP